MVSYIIIFIIIITTIIVSSSSYSREMLKVMKCLDVKKAMGADEIAGWVVKEGAEQLGGPVCDILHKSLDDGKVPNAWKRESIMSFYKGSYKEDQLNYRPVSLINALWNIYIWSLK